MVYIGKVVFNLSIRKTILCDTGGLKVVTNKFLVLTTAYRNNRYGKSNLIIILHSIKFKNLAYYLDKITVINSTTLIL